MLTFDTALNETLRRKLPTVRESGIDKPIFLKDCLGVKSYKFQPTLTLNGEGFLHRNG